MKRILLAAALLLLFPSCTDEDNTRRTLREAGYTDIKTTGYEMFACSDDDIFSTGFSARGPTGVYVNGTVCCGALKNCTIRH